VYHRDITIKTKTIHRPSSSVVVVVVSMVMPFVFAVGYFRGTSLKRDVTTVSRVGLPLARVVRIVRGCVVVVVGAAIVIVVVIVVVVVVVVIPRRYTGPRRC